MKELKYLKDLYSEKELVDFKCVVICVYKSAHTDVYSFLNRLETLSSKDQLNRKKCILCGDWNINFLRDSVQLQDLHSVLLSSNLTNTVTLPTRVTKNISSLIDVMIINKHCNNNLTEVVNLEYSDHFSQILCFLVNKQYDRMEKITRRNFSRRNIENFKYLLEKERLSQIDG